MAPTVRIYTSEHCWHCDRAKALLSSKGIEAEEIDVTHDPVARTQLMELSGGRRTVPVIFIGDACVGGRAELEALDKRGELDSMLGVL